MNNLFKKLKECKLTKKDVDEINIKGFLYSVGRLNLLQITAYLTIKCKEKGVLEQNIYELLAD